MFGKKHVPAKAVTKPDTGEEAIEVRRRVREKYPQMSEAGWGVAKAIKKAREESKSSGTSVKKHQATAQSSLEGALTKEEIARLSGKKKSK